MTADPTVDRFQALIGSWRTRGEVFGEDGSTVATVDGSDVYTRLGHAFVVHSVDVHIAGEHVEALEMIGPYDPATAVFATCAYGSDGDVQTSTADVDDDGVWTFRADGAEARLQPADDGQSMRADWVRFGDGGARHPWMRLQLTRVDDDS